MVRIGDVGIGGGSGCFVIAEAGVNHDGLVSRAHELVDVAADAGADAVKFQTFDPAAVVAAGARSAPYQRQRGESPSQRELLDALVLPLEAWRDLADHARARGLLFLSTAFDVPSIAVLLELGVPALKVPSGEIDNAPFIRQLSSYGLPLLISTGLSTMDEVARSVELAADAPGLCLFHCVTAYPSPVDESNLRAIPAMAERFGVPVGWSDHTASAVTAVAAVALGAALLEKHVTVDRSLRGPDHAASADPDQFASYVADVRAAASALGDGDKRPTAAEAPNRVHVRRSFHAAHDLPQGRSLVEADLLLLRPATGLPPGAPVLGRRLRVPVRQGEPITADVLD